MRRLYIGALVGAMALAVAAVAYGATTQNFTMNFAVPGSGGTVKEIQKPKKSTGVAVDLSSSDPDNPKNGQPDALRRLDLDFPAGSKVDPTTVPYCKATDTELEQEGPSACPGRTKIGTGHATAKFPSATAPNGQPLPDPQVDVQAFNRKGGLLLHLQPKIGDVNSNPIILRPKWIGTLTNGPVLRTDIPPNCLPPAQNVNGTCRDPSTGAEGDEVILNSFQLTTQAKSRTVIVRRNGKRVRVKKILIKTPGKCPSGGWEFKGKFTYKSGELKNISYKDNCTR